MPCVSIVSSAVSQHAGAPGHCTVCLLRYPASEHQQVWSFPQSPSRRNSKCWTSDAPFASIFSASWTSGTVVGRNALNTHTELHFSSSIFWALGSPSCQVLVLC